MTGSRKDGMLAAYLRRADPIRTPQLFWYVMTDTFPQ